MTRIGDEGGHPIRLQREQNATLLLATASRPALASMSLAPPKPKGQSSADCGSPRGRKESGTKDQQNAQLVVSALDLAVEDRRLAEFRTRCLLQEDPSYYCYSIQFYH